MYLLRCKWDVDRLDERLTTSDRPSVTSSQSMRSVESASSSTATPIFSSKSSASSRSSSAVPTTSQYTSTVDGKNSSTGKTHRVVFLTEQVMHHPPVSAFYGECRERGLVICGNDQISARFTGTGTTLLILI
jgi:oxysterol-binding protein-related protein 9/10/11